VERRELPKRVGALENLCGPPSSIQQSSNQFINVKEAYKDGKTSEINRG
jgi:hypothetical protein